MWDGVRKKSCFYCCFIPLQRELLPKWTLCIRQLGPLSDANTQKLWASLHCRQRRKNPSNDQTKTRGAWTEKFEFRHIWAITSVRMCENARTPRNISKHVWCEIRAIFIDYITKNALMNSGCYSYSAKHHIVCLRQPTASCIMCVCVCVFLPFTLCRLLYARLCTHHRSAFFRTQNCVELYAYVHRRLDRNELAPCMSMYGEALDRNSRCTLSAEY